MGACFNDMTLDGKLTPDQVEAKFSDRCRQDGYEEGHSYSGSFSEFNGLVFTGKEFDTADEAYDWLQDQNTKWGPALCVRHKLYDVPKSALTHIEQRHKLQQKIWNAEHLRRLAVQKAQANKRLVKPAYVIKAEEKLEKVREKIQPKIDERDAKIKELKSKAAKKSKKFVWYLGGLCSS